MGRKGGEEAFSREKDQDLPAPPPPFIFCASSNQPCSLVRFLLGGSAIFLVVLLINERHVFLGSIC